MAKNENVEAEVIFVEEAQADVLHFAKPITWEGKEYKFVDLSGLEDIKASDMIEAQRMMERSGDVSLTPEMSLNYACFMASRCSGMPIEFFHQLPAKEALRLKNRVIGFFYGRD